MVKWQNVINVMNGSIRSVKAFQIWFGYTIKHGIAVNAVLTRTLCLYDDLNLFLALNFFVHMITI